MITDKVQFEITKNQRSYQLIISPDSPLGELYDVLSEMRGGVFNKIKEVEEQEKKKEEGNLDG